MVLEDLNNPSDETQTSIAQHKQAEQEVEASIGFRAASASTQRARIWC
jgi:hypothetical protein